MFYGGLPPPPASSTLGELIKTKKKSEKTGVTDSLTTTSYYLREQGTRDRSKAQADRVGIDVPLFPQAILTGRRFSRMRNLGSWVTLGLLAPNFHSFFSFPPPLQTSNRQRDPDSPGLSVSLKSIPKLSATAWCPYYLDTSFDTECFPPEPPKVELSR
ncbi:hypothetical protein ASPBRDRAFT_66077 [Aspergillus brasiliensis CBS 101740]|uniref:Uncharacterized protein n=1 Tax=Aspergillus brasiliensis (strain CBS 101740 / IMI 381727 / IBT 21946) TaxID=767769 RepID=A0A1L9UH84_ASPBC|nr:hypothetical protein ASPBRDRAFT_66077 [Aspergillus brasiliensis CBS 101740]